MADQHIEDAIRFYGLTGEVRRIYREDQALVLDDPAPDGYDASAPNSPARVTLYQDRAIIVAPHFVIISCLACGNVKAAYGFDATGDLTREQLAHLNMQLSHAPRCDCLQRSTKSQGFVVASKLTFVCSECHQFTPTDATFTMHTFQGDPGTPFIPQFCTCKET